MPLVMWKSKHNKVKIKKGYNGAYKKNIIITTIFISLLLDSFYAPNVL